MLERSSLPGWGDVKMADQNKQQSDGICSLYSLLESGNLLDYYKRFLDQGGDDINQLCEATDEEFKEITKLVGMQTKPLHIRRLQKSLVEWKNKTKSGKISSSTVGSSWMDKWNSTQPSHTTTGITITKPTTTTLTITSPANITSGEPSVTEKKRGRPPNSSKAAKKMKSGVFELKLPPMEAIIDWESLDEERKQLIREHSRIYGRDTKKRKTHALNGHEQMINEAAAQLCLRDPTLLVRRDELFTQARRIVRDSGFSFVHGHSRSKYAGEQQIAEEDEGILFTFTY